MFLTKCTHHIQNINIQCPVTLYHHSRRWFLWSFWVKNVINSFGAVRIWNVDCFEYVWKDHSDYEKRWNDYVVKFTQLKGISQTSRRQLGHTRNCYVINVSCGTKHSFKYFISPVPPRVHTPNFSSDLIHRILRDWDPVNEVANSVYRHGRSIGQGIS
jgi:hypothetical protein